MRTNASRAYRASRRVDTIACLEHPWRMVRPLGSSVRFDLPLNELIPALKWKLDCERNTLTQGRYYASINRAIAADAALIAARYLRRYAR